METLIQEVHKFHHSYDDDRGNKRDLILYLKIQYKERKFYISPNLEIMKEDFCIPSGCDANEIKAVAYLLGKMASYAKAKLAYERKKK